jgi:4-amino-4-deoxy-L-arabinose transferase-like glycosyltransferase
MVNVTVSGRLNQAHPAVVYGLLAILMAAVLVPMSVFRIVDGDEGTYLLVSRLVSEGQLLYHDFFYPQMFLLPYVYGGWMKLFGYSWYMARVLSAVFAVALGLLVYREAARLAGARAWGVLAVVLFTFTSFVFGWYPLVKTFVLPTLMLFAAHAVLPWASRWRWVASGALIGLAVDCRVYLVAVVPAFLVELYLTEPGAKRRLIELGRFGVGFLIALLPNEFFLLVEPRTFLFNIVQNQVIRTDFGFLGWMEQKRDVGLQLLAINSADGVSSFQFLVLFLLNLVSVVSGALTRERPSLMSLTAFSLILVSLMPTPVYTQYFCIPIPFMIVGAVAFLASLARETHGRRLRHLFASVAVMYVLVSPLDLYRYTVGGDFVPGVVSRADVINWKLPTIRAVSRAIDQEVRADRPVAISFWPGYFVETKAVILPGMENHFALMFAGRVQPPEIAQFKLMSYPQLASHFRNHTTDVIVVGNWTSWTHNGPWIRSQIVENGYVMKEKIAGTEIYTLPPNGHR